MSWFDRLADGFEDGFDYVFDRDAYEARRLAQALAPFVVERAKTKGWSCKRCKHKNPHSARFCGGCAREKGSPV